MDHFETWNLPTRHLGRMLHFYPRLDSTNTLALSLADDISNNGLAILAHEQTAGRGQHGRSWQAAAGSSILLSVLLFPPPALRRPALLTAWAAVSVCEFVAEATGYEASIKWPNDVLLSRKKICGILIEQRATSLSDGQLATVVGIGLNVTQDAQDFLAAGLPLAGSLLGMTGKRLEYRPCVQGLIQQLDDYYDLLLHGEVTALESGWKRYLDLVGKEVSAETIHGMHTGRLLDIALDGVILDVDGDPMNLPPESIRHLTYAPASTEL